MRLHKSSMVILAGLCVIIIIVVLAIKREPRMPAASPPTEVSAEPSPGERQAPPEILRRQDFLWGRVVDAEGNPVGGATVEAGVFAGESPDSLTQKVFVLSTTTDVKGEFEFRDSAAFSPVKEILEAKEGISHWLGKGLQSLLVASRERYFAARHPIDFGSPTGLHKIVLKKSPEVSGHVVWKESQEPFARVNVVCRPEKPDLYSPSTVECRSDEDGRFSLAVPARGPAGVGVEGWLPFTAFGLAGASADVTLVPGERISDLILTVELGSGTIIEGKVLNGEGEPVPGAEVRLSTDKRVGSESRSQDDGTYWLAVPKDWPYQSYFVEDWPGKPELRQVYHGATLCVVPKEGGQPAASESGWEWTPLWGPPLHAPPERLVAIHPDYAIGVVEVPFLGVGQVRRGVDIVLDKGARVSGKVVDDRAAPVEAANIEIKVAPEGSPVLIKNDNEFIRWEKITSGKEGTFEVCFLREGIYELTASHDDCDPATKKLELAPHQVVEGFDFVLVKRTGFIRGKVFDQSGNPWPQGNVRAGTGDYSGLGRMYEAEVKKDGRYELNDMKIGNYNLWLDLSAAHVEVQGVLSATSLRNIPTGTEGADIVVTERPAGSLRVQVIDTEQQPIERFFIRCCPLSLAYGPSGLAPEPLTDKGDVIQVGSEGSFSMGEMNDNDPYASDAKHSAVLLCRREVVSESGEFIAERVAPGRYFVSVRTDKHGEKFKEVEIVAGPETHVVFELEGLGRLEGIVVDSSGQPLEGIDVRALSMSDLLSMPDEPTTRNMVLSGSPGRWAKSGPDGRFAFENLERAEHRIIAEATDGRSVFADVDLREDGQGFVELALTQGSSSIEGYVWGEDGRPLSKRMVALQGNHQSLRTETDQQGHYIFRDLFPGRYLVKGWIGAMGGWGVGPCRGQEVELDEGGRASVDIIASGDGEIEGKISLAGDAARAAAWSEAGPFKSLTDCGKKLVLREVTDRGVVGKREISLPVPGETFQFNRIPAGTYEMREYFTVRFDPEPAPIFSVGGVRLIEASSSQTRGRRALFTSEPQIVQLVSGSRASINLTVSRACFSHYRIPDPTICEKQAIFVPSRD